MNTKLILSSLDGKAEVISNRDLRREFRNLGIGYVKIDRYSPLAPMRLVLTFKNQEDLNLYKLTGLLYEINTKEDVQKLYRHV